MCSSSAGPAGPGPGGPSVAVLVELEWNALAGGHLKCWERFAEAAARLGSGAGGPEGRGDGAPAGAGVDLTVYVLGDRERVEPLSPHVRFVVLRPVISSAPLAPALGRTDASDLVPYHPALARLLPRHDVWHLTHTFAFAATAVRMAHRERRNARRNPAAGRPHGLIGSVHTDVPALTAAYLRQLTDRLHTARPVAAGLRPAAHGPARSPAAWSPASSRPAAPARAPFAALSPFAAHPARLSPEALAAGLARHRRDRLLRACDRVLVSTPEERSEMGALLGPDRVSLFGRGIDHERFRPDPGARGWLARTHGVPADRTAVVFAGRVDASKRVMMLAEAVRRLLDTGRPVHLVVAGTGADSPRVRALLGPGVTLLGTVPQERLAQVYAGCDVLAFPSRSETAGNVVAEAMACGLPVVLPAGARTRRWLAAPGADGLLVADDDAAGWARALATLVDRPEARTAMGQRAAGTARLHHRSWDRVLREDLLPHWYAVSPRHRPEARTAV
ncbi:glycosyltransferase [Streptomyces sp. WAC 00631]|uniref:glycosyltransferase n=1 Tax=Streptomyces sp. WAC 00631 TaxID=2203201 RepID=UPI001E6093F2|nr:glycosyltransferase [Streptomyces sp. WAC 00631]MCC5036638.1 glycosyltransferase [Streptomyces sp. WAC 00631]